MCPDIMKFIVAGDAIDTDPNGYLLNLDDWSEDIASSLAESEKIELTEPHWEIVKFLRNYYQQYGHSPNVRSLIKIVAKEFGEEKGNKKYLYDLFPNGPSRQGCRIAGLPLPNDCIDYS